MWSNVNIKSTWNRNVFAFIHHWLYTVILQMGGVCSAMPRAPAANVHLCARQQLTDHLHLLKCFMTLRSWMMSSRAWPASLIDQWSFLCFPCFRTSWPVKYKIFYVHTSSYKRIMITAQIQCFILTCFTPFFLLLVAILTSLPPQSPFCVFSLITRTPGENHRRRPYPLLS